VTLPHRDERQLKAAPNKRDSYFGPSRAGRSSLSSALPSSSWRMVNVATKQAPVVAAALVAIALSICAVAGGASTGSASSARVRFADQVLAEAPVPLGSHPLSRAPSLLDEPDETQAFPGLIDLHHIYSTADSPNQVFAYVLDHLPKGASDSGMGTSGGPTGSTSFVIISISTSGPHEYLADLVYSVLSNPSGSTVRVDAQTVWEPSRSPTEKIPTGAVAKLIGYRLISIAGGATEPVSLTLGKRQSTMLARAFDELPVGPGPTCLENPILYQIVFRTPDGPAYQVTGGNCAKSVTILVGGRELQPLYDAHCTLMKLVAEYAPIQARSTRRDTTSKCEPVE
jgi:hypothetical protein